jgi:hypothetical protein
MRITIDVTEGGESSVDRNASPRAAVAAEEEVVVDAGPAPVEFIKGAPPASLEAVVFDAGPTRAPPQHVPAPAERDLPLNPLRAGAAIARGIGYEQASAADRVAPEDGGSAPKPSPQDTPTRRPRNPKARPPRPAKDE